MKSNFISPLEGKLISLKQIEDNIFSQEKLGTGFAIEITGNHLIAPFSGTLLAVFPTGHAYILRSEDDVEIMIHLGIDTTDTKEFFKPLVNKYDFVKQGTVLAEINLDLLKKADKSLISPIVFTNKPKINILKQNKTVSLGEHAIIAVE